MMKYFLLFFLSILQCNLLLSQFIELDTSRYKYKKYESNPFVDSTNSVIVYDTILLSALSIKIDEYENMLVDTCGFLFRLQTTDLYNDPYRNLIINDSVILASKGNTYYQKWNESKRNEFYLGINIEEYIFSKTDSSTYKKRIDLDKCNIQEEFYRKENLVRKTLKQDSNLIVTYFPNSNLNISSDEILLNGIIVDNNYVDYPLSFNSRLYDVDTISLDVENYEFDLIDSYGHKIIDNILILSTTSSDDYTIRIHLPINGSYSQGTLNISNIRGSKNLDIPISITRYSVDIYGGVNIVQKVSKKDKYILMPGYSTTGSIVLEKNGQRIASKNVGASEAKLSTNDLMPGIYQLNFYGCHGSQYIVINLVE